MTLLRKAKRFGKWAGGIVLSLILLFFILNLLFPLHDRIEYSTVITDQRGALVHAYLTSDQKWRMKTELSEISPTLQKAIVAKEDRYFYSHPGINPVAILRAFMNNLFHFRVTSGASTITMQVARALGHRKRTVGNKLIETFRALQLEMKYSKKEILQLYLNLVPYGGNIEGVKSAAEIYFNKNPDHLSLAEITALSVIPNRPSTLVIGRRNDLVVAERNKWLQRFAEEKVFTQKEIADALTEPLTATRTTVPALAPHLAYKLKKNGGDIIHSFINLNTQLKAEKIVADYSRALRMKNIRNAAVEIIDNRTHHVIAYVGSADFNDTTDGGQVNGAAAIREPGSTLKPLLYGLCFDEGLETPKMVVSDVGVNYAGYSPENYDRKFNGYVSVEYALEHSLNIPAVKSLRMLGRDKLISKLIESDFMQVKRDRNKLGLSMILGGCGASLEELTGLFASFANGGVYTKPRFTTTQDTSKNVRLISMAADYMITDILSRVNRPDFPLNWQATEHLPKIAWKTGTSYGRRDAWSIGYNKNFTVGVWVGNFSGTGVADLSGANVATPLLFRLFNTIDYDGSGEWFSLPEGCEQRKVCSETGLLPTDRCTSIVMDYFIPQVSSMKLCDNWQQVTVSADGKMSYCKSCAPVSGFRRQWYRVIEPEMQLWMEDNHIAFEKVPPHNPACETIFREGSPVITSPLTNAEYLINRKDREPIQLTCKTAGDVSRVFWYINNHFYKSGEAGQKQFFVPDEGPVKISCTDDKGRNKDIWIKVTYVNL